MWKSTVSLRANILQEENAQLPLAFFFAPVLAANLPLLSEAGGAKINFSHQQSKKKKLPSYPILTMCRKELSEVLPSEMELPMVEEDIQKGQWSISWDI